MSRSPVFWIVSLAIANVACAALLLASPAKQVRGTPVVPRPVHAHPSEVNELPAPQAETGKRRGVSDARLPWTDLDALLTGSLDGAREVWREFLAACRRQPGGLEDLSAELVDLARPDLVAEYAAALSLEDPARETALGCLERVRSEAAAKALREYCESLRQRSAGASSDELVRAVTALAAHGHDPAVSRLLVSIAHEPEVISLVAIDALARSGPALDRLGFFRAKLADPRTVEALPADMVGQACVSAIGKLAGRGEPEAVNTLLVLARDRTASLKRRELAYQALRDSRNLSGLSQAEMEELESLR